MKKDNNTYGHACSGVYYAFLMACKDPMLKTLVEAVLPGKTLFSSDVVLPDGTPLAASFLCGQSGSAPNTGTTSSSNASN